MTGLADIIGTAREGFSLVKISDMEDALEPKVDEPDLAKKNTVVSNLM